MTVAGISDKTNALRTAKKTDGKKETRSFRKPLELWINQLWSCPTSGEFDMDDSNICTRF